MPLLVAAIIRAPANYRVVHLVILDLQVKGDNMKYGSFEDSIKTYFRGLENNLNSNLEVDSSNSLSLISINPRMECREIVKMVDF